MALTDAQWAAAQVDINARLIAGTITEAQAIAELTAATEDWPTRTLSNADLAARVSRFLARLNGLILTEGPPDIALGELNTFAYDTVNGALYGPKTLAGWGVPVSLVGPDGPAGVISGASISMLAPGAEPTVTMGGTPSDRTLAFGIPAARDGEDGVTPNASAEVAMIAPGQPAVVTRSGPDSAPVFTFQLPRAADGDDGREVELQPGVTHLQWRYVGDATWTNLFARADFKGDPGEKGDAFAFDAKPADLAARAAYDAEPEGFTVLVMDTGTVYARVSATAGVWSDGFPFGQTQNAILTALSELNAAPGLLYQEDGATFSKRAIGAAADTDVLDRQAADARYRRQGQTVPLVDVAGLPDALDEKADAAATLAMLGDKAAKADTYTKGEVDAKIVFATVAEVRAGAVDGKVISPKVMADALATVVIARTDAASGINFSTFINAQIVLDANGTLGPPLGGYPGQTGLINVSNATGSATLAFATAYRMPKGGITIEGGVNAATRIPYMIGGAGAVILFPASKWSA